MEEREIQNRHQIRGHRTQKPLDTKFHKDRLIFWKNYSLYFVRHLNFENLVTSRYQISQLSADVLEKTMLSNSSVILDFENFVEKS